MISCYFVQALKRRITDAKEIMSNMDMQIKIWRAELLEAEIKIDCAPGDAMLVGGPDGHFQIWVYMYRGLRLIIPLKSA